MPYDITVLEDGTEVIRVISRHPVLDRYGVPLGYFCDGASIPKWLWWLCGRPTEYPRIIAAIVHDWLYDSHLVTRRQADRIYLGILGDLGVSMFRAITEYACIRALGWKNWND